MKMQLVIAQIFYLLATLVIISSIHIQQAYAQWVWNKDAGGYIDTGKKVGGKDIPNQRYQKALALVTEERYADALAEFKKLAKKYKKSKIGEKAQFKVAEMYQKIGKAFNAFKAYEKLLDSHPTTTLSRKVVRNEFELGKILAPVNKAKAIEIFQKVVERNATSPYAAEAELRTGDCYHDMGKHEDAKAAYQRVIAVYSSSEWVSAAQFRAGRCGLELYKSTGDVSDLTNAQQDLRGYISLNPKGKHVKEASEKIKEIQSLEAKKEFDVAEYYYRKKRPLSAAVYYKLIIKKYPNTKWAEESKARLEDLE